MKRILATLAILAALGAAGAAQVSDEVKVGAQIRGQLKAVRVGEGSHVRKGQIVAILENDDYMAQCALAEKGLKQARATKREAEIASAFAKVEQARALWEKTFVRAPADGVIARMHLKPGEAVSERADQPILTMLRERIPCGEK